MVPAARVSPARQAVWARGESLAGPLPGGVPGEPEPPVSDLPFAGPDGAGPAGAAAAGDPGLEGSFGAQTLSTDGSLAAGAGAEESSAASGMAGFPMMGAGTAQPEQDRKRHAWLNEDADIWGQPADLVPSVVERDG